VAAERRLNSLFFRITSHVIKPIPGLFLILILLVSISGTQDLFAQDADENKTFIMSMRSGEIELNPLFTYTSLEAQIYTALYEGLVAYDPFSLRPIDGVARSWEILDDGTRYRFSLNQDARYWNGDRVTADHFRDSWLKMLSLGEQSPFGFLLDPVTGARDFRLGRNPDPESVGIIAVSDDVLEITLDNPTSHFLSILAHQSLVAIHPDNLHTEDWSGLDSPLGSGPYQIIERNEDRILMERNEYYWDRDHSEYDRILIQFNDDNSDATARFNSGEIQWLYSGFNYSEIQIPNSLQITPQFATSYYFFSAEKPPFDDERIRRALMLLLPLNEIRSEEIYFVPSANLIPQIPGYPDVNGIEDRDVKAALDLLKDAGYEGGLGLPEIQIVLTDDRESMRIAALMEEAWTESLDVRVTSSFLGYREHQEAMRQGEFVIGSLAWVADYADPMSFLQLWTSDSTINDSGYRDDEFDTLVEESNGLSGTERFEQLGRAEEYLLQSAVVMPVSHSPSFNIIDLEVVGGWYPNPLDIHPFKYFYEISRKPPANVASAGDL
jgi:oligopeptide transport system substrate-binding protein